MRIMIIDDDPDNIAIFYQVISELYPSASCSSLDNCLEIESAIKALPTQDAVLVDGHMFPGHKECMHEINKVIDNQRTKIIVVSEFMSVEASQEVMTLGSAAVFEMEATYPGLKNSLQRMFSALELG